MSGINTGKVLTGGLVAGVVLNVIDFVSNLLLAGDFEANASRLGLDPAAMEAPAAMATWIGIDLVMGILLVFVYAAIRPRFGAGPKTASVAGVTLWFAVSLILFGLATMGMMDMPLYWKSSICALVSVVIGANVGAWLYKEA